MPLTSIVRRLRLVLAVTLIAVAAQPSCAAGAGKVGVLALALWGDQGVFLSEASKAARLMSLRYGHAVTIVRSNSRRVFAAGPAGMVKALHLIDRSLDPERDVLAVILTSHGSPQGIAEKGGGVEGLLSPHVLADLMGQSRVRRKVLIVSACYAGIFAALANPDLLVITAADADHPSFGCSAGATWTYFGDAFFNKALRAGTAGREPIDRVFSDAAVLVRQRELADGFEPSNPQIAGGTAVLQALKTIDGR